MEAQEGSVKRKSRLAVFQHIVRERKCKKKRFLPKLNRDANNPDYSSPSESELVIEDEKETVKKKNSTKKKNPMIKLSEEILSLQCGWKDCEEVHSSWEKFNVHLVEHATNQSENFCCWRGCEDTDLQTVPLLMQHMSHHGYISKLQNLGQNISKRNKLPSCKESHKCTIPVLPFGYKCEWEFCSFDSSTIYDFVDHMNVHIKNNPKRATAKETINCCWKACNTKYLTQTKLAEHIRIHTGEKVVGCPSCGRLFSNKTKFCDHRKRQLSTELQSYQCSQCLKLFPSERLLRDHMRSHVNHYKCTMCDMTCPKPSILAKHIRFKHIKFKPYKCPDCDKEFVEKYNLNTHLKTHEKQKPLKCSVCEFECRSRVGLENHYLKKHDGPGLTYQCHCCKKKFKRGTYLTKHLTKLHNFHWPSGHSRFRFRKDQDGIYRLQTVRYESLEVTQEMILSESMQTTAVKKTETYNLRYDNDGKSGYVLSISENGEQSVRHMEKKQDKNILITINDLDEDGNIMKCEIVESEIVESTLLPANEITNIDTALNVGGNDNGQRDDGNDSSDFEMDTLELENHVLNPEDEDDVGKMKGTILDYEIFKNN